MFFDKDASVLFALQILTALSNFTASVRPGKPDDPGGLGDVNGSTVDQTTAGDLS